MKKSVKATFIIHACALIILNSAYSKARPNWVSECIYDESGHLKAYSCSYVPSGDNCSQYSCAVIN